MWPSRSGVIDCQISGLAPYDTLDPGSAEDEQGAIASQILASLADEESWKARFAAKGKREAKRANSKARTIFTPFA
jgi:hypothetical protein